MLGLNYLVKMPRGLKKDLQKYTEIITEEFRIQKEGAIVFCDKGYIRKLNKKYRGLNCSTDVLSFPMVDEQLLGDIFICPEYVKVQASEYGNTFLGELLYMIIHGLCHLNGHDHHNWLKSWRMVRAEQKMINKLKQKGFLIKGHLGR